MSEVVSRPVAKEEDGIRLDRWFKRHYPTVTHGRLEKLLRTGQIRIDGARAKSSDRLRGGQVVRVPPIFEGAAKTGPRPPISDKDAAFIRNLVLHQAPGFFVLNKPAGIAVQGGNKTMRHIDGMLGALASEGAERPRLVHRLDRDTSGCLVIARSAAAAAELSRQFRSRAVAKIYWALVEGVPSSRAGTINLPLAKEGPRGEERMTAHKEAEDGQRATTHYEVVSVAGRKFAWVALMPVTGRTHQLRAHLSAIGHPIVGDPKYGNVAAVGGGELPPGMHLHARRIALPGPGDTTVRIEAPLPPHMAQTWKLFGFEISEANQALAAF